MRLRELQARWFHDTTLSCGSPERNVTFSQLLIRQNSHNMGSSTGATLVVRCATPLATLYWQRFQLFFCKRAHVSLREQWVALGRPHQSAAYDVTFDKFAALPRTGRAANTTATRCDAVRTFSNGSTLPCTASAAVASSLYNLNVVRPLKLTETYTPSTQRRTV